MRKKEEEVEGKSSAYPIILNETEKQGGKKPHTQNAYTRILIDSKQQPQSLN